MEHELNSLGQPVGLPVPDWKPRGLLRPKRCKDASARSSAWTAKGTQPTSTRPTPPMPGEASGPTGLRPVRLAEGLSRLGGRRRGQPGDPVWYAVIDKATRPAPRHELPAASTPRSSARSKSATSAWSPQLQRTPAATEAMYPDDGERLRARLPPLRVEVQRAQCAFARGGATPRLLLRRRVPAGADDKGRNRDTTWYAIIDKEWPALQAAFRQWLSPANFDEHARQRTRLSRHTSGILKQRG